MLRCAVHFFLFFLLTIRAGRIERALMLRFALNELSTVSAGPFFYFFYHYQGHAAMCGPRTLQKSVCSWLYNVNLLGP
jgi:hypothetical protein